MELFEQVRREYKHLEGTVRGMARNAFLGFRLNPEVKKRIEEIASREDRSLSQVCEIMLRQWTEDYAEEGPRHLQRILSQAQKKQRDK